MIKLFFHWEILLFTTTDISWAGFALIGLLLGRFLRQFTVRRKSEFKGSCIAVMIIWLGLHIINLLFLTAELKGLATLMLSRLSAFAPVSTFMVIGFILTDIIKRLKDKIDYL